MTGQDLAVLGLHRPRKIKRKGPRNPKRSIRKMAATLGMSKGSKPNLVKRNLGLKSLKWKTVRKVLDQQTAKRLKRCKDMKQRFVTWGARKVLLNFSPLNMYRTTKIVGSYPYMSPLSLMALRSQQPSSVVVWAGVSSEIRTHLVLLPSGVRINAGEYMKQSFWAVVKPFGPLHFGNTHWTTKQDVAPAHTAEIVQEWCQREIPNFVSKDQLTPSSPDGNPMDFVPNLSLSTQPVLSLTAVWSPWSHPWQRHGTQ